MDDQEIEKVQKAIFESIEKRIPKFEDELDNNFITGTVYQVAAKLVMDLSIDEIKDNMEE